MNFLDTALEGFRNKFHWAFAILLASFPRALYLRSIKLFGTIDNYNTETHERLYTDLAKDAYQATNSKVEFSHWQMTVWLRVEQQENYVACSLRLMEKRRNHLPASAHFLHHFHPRLHLKLTPHSTRMSVHLNHYGTPHSSLTFISPFNSLSAFYKIKSWNEMKRE